MKKDKKVAAQSLFKTLLFILPLVTFVIFIFMYIIPLLESTIVAESQKNNEHLCTIIDEQFYKIEQIKENMTSKSFVKSLYNITDNSLYGANNTIIDLNRFREELYNINDLSSITAEIGVYNKKNNTIYHTKGYNDIDWFFSQVYSVDNKSSAYWTKFFNDIEFNDDISLVGPFEANYYGTVYYNSYVYDSLLYVTPIKIGPECELVFFAFIDIDELTQLISIFKETEDSKIYLYYNEIEINLSGQDSDFNTVERDLLSDGKANIIDEYIITSSSKVKFSPDFNIVIYSSRQAAFNDINILKKYMIILIVIVLAYVSIFTILVNKKQNEIDRRRENELIINSLMRVCYNFKDEHDMDRLSQFHDMFYMIAAASKINIIEEIEYKDNYKLVKFTCEKNVIIIVCCDEQTSAEEFLKEFVIKKNINHIGVARPCKIDGIHDAFAKAMDAYDASKYSSKSDILVHYQDLVSDEFDSKLLEYVTENFTNSNLSLKDLAEYFEMNTSNVSRQFKKLTGEHFRSYLMGLRIKKACSLLLNTSESVNNISKMSGYDNPASFRRIFKQIMGISPSEYRESKDILKNK
jgi:YesN/AraC family two-component response regulator